MTSFPILGSKSGSIFVTLIESLPTLTSTRESSPNHSVNDILPFILIPIKSSLFRNIISFGLIPSIRPSDEGSNIEHVCGICSGYYLIEV